MNISFKNKNGQNISYKESDLVMLRYMNDMDYSNSWWRVVFIDNNNIRLWVF